MKLCSRMCLVAVLTGFFGCGVEDDTGLLIYSEVYDFSQDDYGWVGGFADYPAGPDDSTYYQLEYAYTDWILSAADRQKSHMLSGYNHNQDLFMYLKKQVGGLKPNTDYTITFSIELASDLTFVSVTQNGVYLKAGATHIEPRSVIEGGYHVMNIDKGNQFSGGEDMTILGKISVPQNLTGYSMVTKTTNTMANSRYVAKSNSNGELWLIIGSDSGIETSTTLYYTKVNVVFSAS